MKFFKTPNEVTLEDGRTFTFDKEKGKKTVLPTGERVYYKDSYALWYLGESWEFTGRMKYNTNPKWEEPYCYAEVIYIWEADHWIIPFKKVIKTNIEWVNFDHFKYDYGTTETIVECES
jgi:hypothetical protein